MTAIVIVHHERKPQVSQSGGKSRAINRGRGSTIIGATLRHCMAIEEGPDTNQLLITVEGNLEGRPDPFVIERRFAEAEGRKWVRHELVGTEADARRAGAAANMDPVILALLGEAGDTGMGKRAVRDAVRERIGKASSGTVDDRLRFLVLEGKAELTVARLYRLTRGAS